jgi:hypothetical protein
MTISQYVFINLYFFYFPVNFNKKFLSFFNIDFWSLFVIEYDNCNVEAIKTL